jgi:hypothetical protein
LYVQSWAILPKNFCNVNKPSFIQTRGSIVLGLPVKLDSSQSYIMVSQCLHWQIFLAKACSISQCDYVAFICLSQVGQHDKNRNRPFCVALLKVAKASTDGMIVAQNCKCFSQKNFTNVMGAKFFQTNWRSNVLGLPLNLAFHG